MKENPLKNEKGFVIKFHFKSINVIAPREESVIS